MTAQTETDRCEYAERCQGGPVAPPLWRITYGRGDASGVWVCSRHIARVIRELQQRQRVSSVVVWPPRGVTR